MNSLLGKKLFRNPRIWLVMLIFPLIAVVSNQATIAFSIGLFTGLVLSWIVDDTAEKLQKAE